MGYGPMARNQKVLAPAVQSGVIRRQPEIKELAAEIMTKMCFDEGGGQDYFRCNRCTSGFEIRG